MGAYRRWRNRIRHPAAVTAPDGSGLVGAALDRAIEALAMRRPDLVMAAR